MAAATAAAASAATAGWSRLCGASCDRGAKHGKLDRSFFAGTFWAGDFLLAIDDDFFELRFAFVADVFVDGHAWFLLMTLDYSKFVDRECLGGFMFLMRRRG